MPRADLFRIAVRKYPAFEAAIAAQWAAFEAEANTGLTLDAVPFDLPELERTLFHESGMLNGSWDVAFVATDWIAGMHAAGAALDLSQNFDMDGTCKDAWPDSLLRLQQVGRAVLGIPYHDGPECLILRRDLFESPENKARFLALHGAPLAPPKSWEEFHRIARFFHDPSQNLHGTVFAALPDGHNSVYDFLLQLWTRGGDLFDARGNLHFNTPEARAALTFYRSMLADQTAVHPGSRNFDSVQAGLAIARGEVAMMVNWFGFATYAHASPESAVRGQIDIADIPGIPAISLNIYWILSIAAGSPHPEVALRFLQHCATPAMDLLTTQSGAIGCRKSTWSDPSVNAAIPFYHRLESLHAIAREIPRRADWPRIAAIIDTLVTATTGSEIPVETLLAEADQSFQSGGGS